MLDPTNLQANSAASCHRIKHRYAQRLCFGILAVIIMVTPFGFSQNKGSFQRGVCLAMLDSVHDAVKKHYYDASFHGVDIDAKFGEARQKMRDVDSFGSAYRIIEEVVDLLNDSHTHFIPPRVPFSLDYGFRNIIIGGKSFVMAVRPNSDAEKQGIKKGDLVEAIDGHELTRTTNDKLTYELYTLSPQEVLSLDLVTPDKLKRQLEINAMIEEHKGVLDAYDLRKMRHEAEGGTPQSQPRYAEYGDDLIIVKLPTFAIKPTDMDSIASRIRKYKAVVIDLRGNPGGTVAALQEFVSRFFDHDVLIANRISRENRKPLTAHGSGSHAYGGKVIVLVDGESSSAAEMFARVMQLEKRGTILGDQTSGQVMETVFYPSSVGMGVVYFFGTEVTDADLIMSDGKSLEHIGVQPDEILYPAPSDLASDRDPVLSRAANLAGVNLAPEPAGKLFPYIWPKF